jgi:hypothetical protein
VALCEACGDGLIGTISCEWDLDGDGVVNVNDLLDVIAGFGTIYTVNDLLAVLSDFGCNSTSPPPIG